MSDGSSPAAAPQELAERDRFRVVITLTGAGGRWLTQQAGERGWQVSCWPGLTFRPTGRAAELLPLPRKGWLLLTSPQGVHSLQSGLAELGLGVDALADLQVAAVGEGTARPLAAWGRPPDFVPSRADARALAAELPAQPGERLLHITGEESRETLGQGLAARGLSYQKLTLYCSEAVQFSAGARCDLRVADCVVLGSGVVARGLAEQLGPTLPLLAMGEQTAEAARRAGFTLVRSAAQPSLEGVLQALEQWALLGGYAGRGQKSLCTPLSERSV